MSEQDAVRAPSGQALSASPTEPVPVSTLPGDDPSRDAEAMRMDITHLLYAIDRGYFGEVFGLADSAFVECLRKYALPGFEPVRKVA